MKSRYRLKNVGDLLTEGFNKEELLNFCFFDSHFTDLYAQLSKDADKTEIVRRIVEYAHQKLLIEIILIWAEAKNPNRYQQHHPYIFSHNDNDLAKTPLSGPIAAGEPIMVLTYNDATEYIPFLRKLIPENGLIYLYFKGN